MCVNSSTQQYNKYGTYLNWPKYVSDSNRVRKVKRQNSIRSEVSKAVHDDHLIPLITKFLEAMLSIDPAKRLSSTQLLSSDFMLYDFPRKKKKEKKEGEISEKKEGETIEEEGKEEKPIEEEREEEREPKETTREVKSDQLSYSKGKESQEVMSKVTKSLETNI